jgi:low-density lipoprotein receptor-related protein 1 (alpha-2-macroglobulin receptor)
LDFGDYLRHFGTPKVSFLDFFLINNLILLNTSDHPRIERATMSGSNRTIIFNISSSVNGGGWPNGLTLDYLFKRIYYIDAKSDSIHVLSYDGLLHKEIIRNTISEAHGYSLALYDDYVYWSDWKSGSIYRV